MTVCKTLHFVCMWQTLVRSFDSYQHCGGKDTLEWFAGVS